MIAYLDYDPKGSCAECRSEFGDEDGIYETPAGAMCADCYDAFTHANERERAREVGWMWDLYNAGMNGGDSGSF